MRAKVSGRDEGVIEREGAFGDGLPAKVIHGALAAGCGHRFAHFGMGHEQVDGFSKILGELLWVQHFKRAFSLLLDIDEEAGAAVDHDFLDAAHCTGDDSGLTGHGFEIDDAERLVNRRATEHFGVRIERDFFLGGHHFIDPNDPRAQLLGSGDSGVHLGSDFGCVWGSGTEHDLETGMEVLDGTYEVDNAFLAGDPADKEDVGLGGIDTVFLEQIRAIDLVIFVRVDAVVNDVDAMGIDVEEAEDVRLGLLGDGDDGVCHLDGGALEPDREIVAATELLAFPGAEGFERVNGEHHRDAVVELGQDAAEVGIPGVQVDELGVDLAGIEVKATLHGTEHGVQVLGSGPVIGGDFDAGRSEMFCLLLLIAEATDVDINELG